MDTRQPTVFAQCTPGKRDSTPAFPVLYHSGNGGSIPYNQTSLNNITWFERISHNSSLPGVLWICLQAAEYGSNSIGGIVAVPSTNGSNTHELFACTLSAHWMSIAIESSFQNGPLQIYGSSDDWYNYQSQEESTRVEIIPEWASGVDFVLPESDNRTVIQSLLWSAGAWGAETIEATNITNKVEAILSLMVTDGMSKNYNNIGIQGSLKDDWKSQILPVNGKVYGHGGEIFDLDGAPCAECSRLQMIVSVIGYGYGLSSAVLFSTCILAVYVFIVSVHVIRSTFTQLSSTAFESVTELVAIAAKSAPPTTLENTGAGISTLETMKTQVRLSASNGHVELIFGDGAVKRVAANRAYG
ncbi:MAG: hypothetical protein M1814_005796 [Vezdaea aestivalis]|nr:MAG: hypothetical protein M1814_005796 [Vezdaea aestivalis]